MVLVRPTIERVLERIGPDQLRDPHYREIFRALVQFGAVSSEDRITGSLSDAAVSILESFLAEPDLIQNVDRTLNDCLAKLELRPLKERNDEIQRLLSAATGEEKDRLVLEKQTNTEAIHRLSQSIAAS
jgi:hypothetical protein